MNDLNQNSLKNSVPKFTKATPKKTFTVLVIITAVLFFVGTLIVTSDDDTLDEFLVHEGQLTKIEVTTTRRDIGQPATPIMIFTVNGLDKILGIGQNAPADFSIYTNNLEVGDKVKVYYDSRQFQTPEGYSPFVRQLEKDGVALLDLNESNRYYKKGGYVGLGLGVLALIGTIIYYRRNIATENG